MIGAQTILKASQAVRTAAPARSLTLIAAPAKHKVPRSQFIALSAVFVVANFAYPVYVLDKLHKKRMSQV